MESGIPPIDPLDLEQYARTKERDFVEGRPGWLQRRRGSYLAPLVLVVVLAAVVFLLTR